MKKNVKNAPQLAPATSPVVFRKCKLFNETWERHKANPAVHKALEQFIVHKASTPLAPFGAKDRRFVAGVLTDYTHTGLTHDVSLIYKISGRNPTVIWLYAIMTHDESGTAGGTLGNKRQQQLQKRLDGQQF